MPDIWCLATITVKWLLYLGVLGASGTVMTAALFGLEDVRRVALKFAMIGLCAALLSFMLKGASLTGDATGMIDPEMLGLLWITQNGSTLMLQMAGLAVLVVGLGLGRIGLVVSTFGALAALTSFAAFGHVYERESWLLSGVLLLHLIGVAIWIGILSPLRRLASDPQASTEAASLGHRFGQVAMVTVPILILAGAMLIYTLAGSVTAMVSTSYGLALSAKVTCVALLLGFAAANKLRFVPRLKAGELAAGQQLARSIAFEWALVLVILVITATLTSTMTLPT